ncbi:hypothetical protein C343_06491 [Cryptococcus neoformans C23]|uniref:histidine kinase n=1 Tax=Cryptococcus neoformans (strain H99 / ATCC 208821 / CBS 10515 / FGSC 9487) TaxID=235443 RepID=J9VVM9_CRYN9|nr:hypothetical protein CNAG_06278 [Cryptococcus neoformans var. grubii H99]AUB28667.1 hypothetical protein CKF44_06278 [Cryptococcus neoformans var. grubii]OWZ38703.1 hypothetical protein C343_06491 [Cryptococcus neoformans var. grubii C23]OXC81351.1 hypothetical protein C344_06395 [Cryptococcus neoformans var. grubii AD1-7a]AFR98512.2 hypothetical protein CNAG_06278 [Cryptococcus neoformans var. grubii H99]OXH23039.1 hypothetical protein J005_06525 [Cryptococcus neoformans var. grubii]|eukprot:XP_012053273.1 hypothetical protein CNAG_06278 [Cryptococcus neoformans var. grubii H99]
MSDHNGSKPPSQDASSTVPVRNKKTSSTAENVEHVVSGPPTTQEEWDRFITDYTMGDLTQRSFLPTKSARSTSALGESIVGQDVVSQASVLPVSPTLSGQMPSTSLPIASSETSRAQVLETIASKSLDDTDILDENSQEPYAIHLNTSSSGPSNQDPDIPNIPMTNEPGQSCSTSKPAEGKTKKFKHPPDMTRENVEKLGDEYKMKAQRGKKASSKQEKKVKVRPMKGDYREPSEEESKKLRKRRARRPRSRGSWVSRREQSFDDPLLPAARDAPLDPALLDSATNSSTSISLADLGHNFAAERIRVREYFQKNGYLPPPRQTEEASRRRLRVIRRLGLENAEKFQVETIDRLARLAVSFFKTNAAVISVIGKSKQLFLSEIGFGARTCEVDMSVCYHAMTMSQAGDQCIVINDASKDWRFRKNPLVDEGRGPVQFYAGSPLRVGQGSKEAIIGTLCVVDDKPRDDFGEDQRELLADLAKCVVSELELLYSQQAAVESAKLHQISVDFLRRSLKHRPLEHAGRSAGTATGSGSTPMGSGRAGNDGSSGSGSTRSLGSQKRIGGADEQSDEMVDIYDEACREIRFALDAYAVAVVDLSQFHVFFPAYQNSSTGGGSTRAGSVMGTMTGSGATTVRPGASSSMDQSTSIASTVGEEDNPWDSKKKQARPTYSMNDPMAPVRTPQVLFIPSRPRAKSKWYNKSTEQQSGDVDTLAVLGYSCAYDNYAFNFTTSPAARKIVADFIASNVTTRKMWYTRDDSEGIAASITHLMPPGTETSLALPVFGFDGQVSFAVVACWKDPLYTYPAGAMQFVETIAGSLLASVLKERLLQAERAQLNFASAASHELRTPLHQINAAANILRTSLQPVLQSSDAPGELPSRLSADDRQEVLAQLDLIDSNSLSLAGILENVIDTLDVGKMSESQGNENRQMPDIVTPRDTSRAVSLSAALEEVVDDAMELESKTRRALGGKGLEDVEVILEVLPRQRGGWLTTKDIGPLARATGKVIHNAIKFTDKGHVHITVQDISREVILPTGYDNSLKVSTISIDIKDSGRGMSADFLDREILQPFSKEDPFISGSGLGLTLTQRILELIGGKIAIASSPGKGTLVHIEVPVQFLNDDSNSDQDDLGRNDGAPDAIEESNAIRTDGIYLIGFATAKNSALRRVGKSLTRQLKLHKCRVVTEINYASLIVAPEGEVRDAELARLCRSARPCVQVIVLERDRTKYGSIYTPSHLYAHTNPLQSRSSPAATLLTPQDQEYLDRIPIIHLTRPIRPSVVRRIMDPAPGVSRKSEQYVSDVVGGDEAKEEAAIGARPSIDHVQKPPSASAPFSEGAEFKPRPITSANPAVTTSTAPPATLEGGSSSDVGSGSEMQNEDQPSVSSSSISGSDTRSGTEGLSGTSVSANGTNGASESAVYGGSETSETSETSNRSTTEVNGKNEGKSDKTSKQSMKGLNLLKVLVVEDNVINRKILTTMLRRVSCSFAEAVDGVDAVDQFSVFQPDLVLLDITMPRKDGFAAAAEMRRLETVRQIAEKDVPNPSSPIAAELIENALGSLDLNAHAPGSSSVSSSPGSSHSIKLKKRARIIAVTAMSAEHQKRKGLYECGIDHWMTKPLSMSVLRSMVEKMKEEINEGT